ncbi:MULTISPECIES: MinD/ParA family protein [Mycolicibacterium]|uniref:MinD/ParA family ATP-binding protein n=1 Tax=Mycolicibacterium sp. TaxID=2320850 RepID=UPI001E2BAEAE|nr:MinD/ParA family protein [Mycolicibacterium mageritense]MCC9184038.1 MinD/ParA family protein [Mycolicibacterium mageritense]
MTPTDPDGHQQPDEATTPIRVPGAPSGQPAPPSNGQAVPPPPPPQPQPYLPPPPPPPQDPRPQPHGLTPISTNFTAAVPDEPTVIYTRRTTAEELGLRPRKQAHQNGWRKVMNRMTGGTMNLPEPQADPRLQSALDRVNQPVRGAYSIAVLSLKGGVGKTTTTVCLGSTFAANRGDRVIAVDANPDFGTLAQRGPSETRSTVRDLLADQEIFRYSDVRRHTSQSPSRLEILASERDPAVSEAFSEADYRAVHDILDRFYNIILTDCGTGLTHSAMNGVLDAADALVLVASPAIDSARSALATLDWLQHHGHAHLVPDATVVLSSARPGAVPVDIDQLTMHFKARVRDVVVIPFDDHLAEGAEISMDLLNRKTRQAFLDLTASVAEGFNRNRRVPRLR